MSDSPRLYIPGVEHGAHGSASSANVPNIQGDLSLLHLRVAAGESVEWLLMSRGFERFTKTTDDIALHNSPTFASDMHRATLAHPYSTARVETLCEVGPHGSDISDFSIFLGWPVAGPCAEIISEPDGIGGKEYCIQEAKCEADLPGAESLTLSAEPTRELLTNLLELSGYDTRNLSPGYSFQELLERLQNQGGNLFVTETAEHVWGNEHTTGSGTLLIKRVLSGDHEMPRQNYEITVTTRQCIDPGASAEHPSARATTQLRFISGTGNFTTLPRGIVSAAIETPRSDYSRTDHRQLLATTVAELRDPERFSRRMLTCLGGIARGSIDTTRLPTYSL